MKPVTVYIPDNQVYFFMELVSKLHFNVKNDDTSFDLTDTQKDILDQRLIKYQANPESYLKWEDVEKDIEKIL